MALIRKGWRTIRALILFFTLFTPQQMGWTRRHSKTPGKADRGERGACLKAKKQARRCPIQSKVSAFCGVRSGNVALDRRRKYRKTESSGVIFPA
jgi:hypothetical protein